MPLAPGCEQQILPPFVSLAGRNDVNLWCLMLQCSEQELRDAVACAGSRSDVVQLYLLCKRLTAELYSEVHAAYH